LLVDETHEEKIDRAALEVASLRHLWSRLIEVYLNKLQDPEKLNASFCDAIQRFLHQHGLSAEKMNEHEDLKKNLEQLLETLRSTQEDVDAWKEAGRPSKYDLEARELTDDDGIKWPSKEYSRHPFH